MEQAIFMIEGGAALDAVKQYIQDKISTQERNVRLATDLGVDKVCLNFKGSVYGVAFEGERHPDFKVPNSKGLSFPKKGTEWHKRFAEQLPGPDGESIVSELFSIPGQINYESKDGVFTGSRCLGNFLNSCGFLYLGKDGPYALYCPDVPAEVAKDEANGDIVAEPAKSFKMEFEGCRRVSRDEWDLLVLQQRVAKEKLK